MNLAEATYVFENNYGDSCAVREAGEIVNAELDRLAKENDAMRKALEVIALPDPSESATKKHYEAVARKTLDSVPEKRGLSND